MGTYCTACMHTSITFIRWLGRNKAASHLDSRFRHPLPPPHPPNLCRSIHLAKRRQGDDENACFSLYQSQSPTHPSLLLLLLLLNRSVPAVLATLSCASLRSPPCALGFTLKMVHSSLSPWSRAIFWQLTSSLLECLGPLQQDRARLGEKISLQEGRVGWL
ncbi:hypothetical protein IE53DRAFT_50338 [Violaceomyces palustris]|uniref:Uncharacterized protein n=1 Tax=Violaceomyces palustris TaxID=1673888 RepID=A0ACD0P0J9_9BASI|nr:hypothetical protein IE53DRAFT_50338 [Violaceomyces palustris]